MEAMFLVKKYLPPGVKVHSSRSLRRVYPARVSMRADSAVAWNEVPVPGYLPLLHRQV